MPPVPPPRLELEALAAVGVPDAAVGGEVFAIGPEGDLQHPGLVRQRVQLLATGHFPDAGGLVAAAGRQPLAVAAEGHGPHRAEVLQGQQPLAGLRVPHAGRFIFAGRGHQFAVGTEDGPDDRGGVAAQRQRQFLAAAEAPTL